jgi:hypothetical protein
MAFPLEQYNFLRVVLGSALEWYRWGDVVVAMQKTTNTWGD